MNTKTLFLALSTMVLGTILLGGIAIFGIMAWSSTSDDVGRVQQEQVAVLEPETQANTQATSGTDFVYLYDDSNEQLLRISLVDGSSQTFGIGIPDDRSVYVTSTTISRDGRMIAYCKLNRLPEDRHTYELVVREIASGQNLLTLDFGAIPGCRVGAFNTAGSQIAMGLIYNSPIEGALNFPDEPNWALRTFDIATGTMMHDLNADMPQAPDYENMVERFWFSEGISAMTIAKLFTDDEILFTAFPYVGRDGPLEVPAHRYNLRTGDVSPVEGLTSLGADILMETGEIVYTEVDEAYPYASPGGPAPRGNVVRINDNGTIRTIYRNPDYVISRATFINGGRQILVTMTQGWDDRNPSEMGKQRFEIINRDGSLGQSSTEFVTFNRASGTATGFLTFHIDQLGSQGNQGQLIHYAGGQPEILWPGNLGVNGWFFLVWTPPMDVADDLQPFATIQ